MELVFFAGDRKLQNETEKNTRRKIYFQYTLTIITYTTNTTNSVFKSWMQIIAIVKKNYYPRVNSHTCNVFQTYINIYSFKKKFKNTI